MENTSMRRDEDMPQTIILRRAVHDPPGLQTQHLEVESLKLREVAVTASTSLPGLPAIGCDFRATLVDKKYWPTKLVTLVSFMRSTIHDTCRR